MTPLPHPSLALTLAAFALVIGVLVFVHEMGHYLVGRWFGIRAEAFSIGFGREIAGWTDRRGTRWKVGILPLGGYVKFAGDADASSRPGDATAATPAERAGMFQFRPIWQRALVILAGPATNFLFATAIFAGFFMLYGQAETPPVIARVLPASPAARAGLAPGDIVVALDGRRIAGFEDIIQAMAGSGGAPVDVTVRRVSGIRTVAVTPAMTDTVDPFGTHSRVARLGIGPGRGQVIVARGPVSAVYHAGREVVVLVRMIIDGLADVVTGRRAVSELGGPVKIAQVSGQAAALGLPNLIEFVAFVSINLGFINLLPVPMLDGGHLFLYAVEAIRRRPLAPKVQEMAFMSGFAALLSLMVFLTWNDLIAVGVWQHLTGLFG